MRVLADLESEVYQRDDYGNRRHELADISQILE